jgi:hypothetical protein
MQRYTLELVTEVGQLGLDLTRTFWRMKETVLELSFEH